MPLGVVVAVVRGKRNTSVTVLETALPTSMPVEVAPTTVEVVVETGQ